LSLNPPDGMAISAWINPNYTSTSDSFSSTNPVYIVYKGGVAQDLEYSFRVLGGKLDFLWRNGLDTSYNSKRMDSHVVKSGWQHVVASHDGSDLSFYIDGVLQNSSVSLGSMTDPHNESGGVFYIGSEYDLQRYFNGSIDEVAIWDRALQPHEVKNIFEHGRIRHGN